MELTIDNIAALYFADYFHLALTAAGFVAASFGMMNLFARALGGILSDRCHRNWGLRGRVKLLGCTLFAEGLALILFSRMRVLPLAVGSMMLAGLFVKMSNGATYSVVPFVNKRALGAVAGIVGAGGNVGAVLAGFLFRTASITWPQALLILGVIVASVSSLTLCRAVLGKRRAIRTRRDRGAIGADSFRLRPQRETDYENHLPLRWHPSHRGCGLGRDRAGSG